MAIYRNYRNIDVLYWMGDDEFTGTIQWGYPNREPQEYACYGWSKDGKTFFVYKIKQGHIERLGTLKRQEIDIPATV